MAQKKKILIRIGSLRHGGAEKVLTTFLKNLPPDKYEIDLLLNLYSGKYLSEIPSWVNILYINKGEMITTNRPQDIPKKAFRVAYQFLLKKFPKLLYNGILKGKKYDVEFAAIHGFVDEMANSPLKNSKKIIWVQNDISKLQNFNNNKTISNFFKFDKILVISENLDLFFRKFSKNKNEEQKIIKIFNPIDTEEMLRNANMQPDKYYFDKSIFTFVSIGTIYPQKGYDRLINVHKKLLDEGFSHKICIVGDGYEYDKIKEMRDSLNLQDTVALPGSTNNPSPYFKNADCYILSSRHEGFPTVLVEAIAQKKNIIATDVSGVREMLNDGNLGLIVENSEEGIYEGMKKALTEPHFFEQYQEKLKDYEMPFNLENSVNKIMEIIDEI